MTKDLALLVGADQKWLSTTGFLDKIERESAQGARGAGGGVMRCVNTFAASALKTATQCNELIVSPEASRYKAIDFV